MQEPIERKTNVELEASKPKTILVPIQFFSQSTKNLLINNGINLDF